MLNAQEASPVAPPATTPADSANVRASVTAQPAVTPVAASSAAAPVVGQPAAPPAASPAAAAPVINQLAAALNATPPVAAPVAAPSPATPVIILSPAPSNTQEVSSVASTSTSAPPLTNVNGENEGADNFEEEDSASPFSPTEEDIGEDFGEDGEGNMEENDIEG